MRSPPPALGAQGPAIQPLVDLLEIFSRDSQQSAEAQFAPTPEPFTQSIQPHIGDELAAREHDPILYARPKYRSQPLVDTALAQTGFGCDLLNGFVFDQPSAHQI
jgi:hypothetical protein